MKRLSSLLTAIFCILAAGAHPDWRMHPTFDEEVTRIVDTPRFTYFTSRTQPYKPDSKYNSEEFLSLFRYDKEGDELLSLSTDNALASNIVSVLEYSPQKKYLAVVHDNYDVDLIFDDGTVENIPDYRLAAAAYDKKVNSVFIDSDKDRIYLSTVFGYVALNDKKFEVAESRIYGESVKSMARLGESLLLLTGNRLLAARASSPRLGLDDYAEEGVFDSPQALYALGQEACLLVSGSGSRNKLYRLTGRNGAIEAQVILEGKFINIEPNSRGVLVAASDMLCQVAEDGTVARLARADGDKNVSAGSYDLGEVWYGEKRKGFWSKRAPGSDGDTWTLTRDCMLPNAPAPFMASNMVWHPERGLLVANHGYDSNFEVDNDGGPLLLSAYRDGFWSNLSPVYTNPGAREPISNPNGLAVDPDNPDLVYFGSLMSGLERINMTDGTDVIHMSRTNDPCKNLPGFVELVPDQTGDPSPYPGLDKSWPAAASFAAPRFDAYGNLWTSFADYDDQHTIQIHLFCWEAADRKATTSASDIRLPKRVKVPGYLMSNRDIVVPLMASGHKNYLAYTYRKTNGEVVIIDTAGTPTDTSDDRTASINTFVDQDGVSFEVSNMTFLWEDPNTGLVWAGHSAGVFYFNPDNVLGGSGRVTRIKVARNDGTNLADYLLDGVRVNGIAVDSQGRKWFSTTGAGVICTSSDGREILAEYTSADSPLPDDNVYGIGYIPATNSMMLSTGKGMAEYFIRGGSSAGDKPEARAYPNPVRPDYFGYVTIDGLPENAVVKITDASGNIVKELIADGSGEARWDVTNLAFKRVSSGVYFILSSNGESGGSLANVGKVLVIN